MKRAHALIIPWPVSQGLHLWCGYRADHPSVADESVASVPEAVTCKECIRAMRTARANLNNWVPQLKD